VHGQGVEQCLVIGGGTGYTHSLVLDATRSMGWRWQDRISKLEYAVNLLGAMGVIHMRQNDPVGLLVHDANRLRMLPPRSKRSHLEALFATLAGVQPGAGGSTFPTLVAHLAELPRHVGRLVLCSDLEEDAEAVAGAMRELGGTRDEVCVLHLLDRAEIELPFGDATHLRDSESGQQIPVNMRVVRQRQAETVAAFREHWETVCAGSGLRYVPLDTGMDYAEAMQRFQQSAAR